MDQSLLVKNGTLLIEALDEEGLSPEAAVWFHDTGIDAWRLWIVPSDHEIDKREFYRRVGSCLNERPDIDLSISDVQLVSSGHRGVIGLSRVFRAEGLSSIHLSNNMLDGFFIPEGIILRLAIRSSPKAA